MTEVIDNEVVEPQRREVINNVLYEPQEKVKAKSTKLGDKKSAKSTKSRGIADTKEGRTVSGKSKAKSGTKKKS